MQQDTEGENIQYRFYRDGDEHGFTEMFGKVFGQPLNLDEWEWHYLNNPAWKSYINIAECRSSMVGSSAAVPFNMNGCNKILTGIRIQHAMVMAEFRRQGIFKQTVENITALRSSENFDLIFTFPTRELSLKTFISLKFAVIGQLYQYNIPASKLQCLSEDPVKYEVQESPVFTSSDAEFIDSCLYGYKVFLRRDADYLNWRYGTLSGKKYTKVKLYDSTGIKALLVYKKFEKDSSYDIMECFVKENSLENIQQVLNVLMIKEGRENISGFNIWSAPHYRIHNAILQLGFEKTALNTHVAVKNLTEENEEEYLNFENYFFSFGDSDVY
jgi:hypothetical protein